MGRIEQDTERAQAALSRAGRTAVVSHELAALAHGLELVDDPVPRLTVPRNARRPEAVVAVVRDCLALAA